LHVFKFENRVFPLQFYFVRPDTSVDIERFLQGSYSVMQKHHCL